MFRNVSAGRLPPTARYSWHLKEVEDWVGRTQGTVELLPDGEAAPVVITHEGSRLRTRSRNASNRSFDIP